MPTRAEQIEKAMADAGLAAMESGVTDAEQIKAAKLKAAKDTTEGLKKADEDQIAKINEAQVKAAGGDKKAAGDAAAVSDLRIK